jgi:predicted amidohydrolase
MNLISLQLKTSEDFDKNLKKLIKKIKNSPDGSIILAPELYLNGYAYDRFEEAVEITNKAIPLLKDLSENKIISLTMTTKDDKKYKNTLFIFHKNKIIHTQSKNRLFVLNDERVHFSQGDEEDIRIIDIDGLKVGALICFELRFIELWERLKGCDIILIPAMWGKLRQQNYETLSRALAVANQCYVIACDSANEDMAKSSAIITPFGEVTIDNRKDVISLDTDLKDIKKMRRYLPIGIK